MNKIYTFIIILPIIAMMFFKTMAFYEYDTKQRYIKNIVDATAHKVMITGVMTTDDKNELLNKLKKLGDFNDGSITLERGILQSDGAISGLSVYTTGDVLDRGDIFSILVQSENESTLSRMEVKAEVSTDKLTYKAKATCRIEKHNDTD